MSNLKKKPTKPQDRTAIHKTNAPKAERSKQYLIVENWDGTIYSYTEDEGHHARSEPGRAARLTRRNPAELDVDCNMGRYHNSYFVFRDFGGTP